MPKSNPGRRGRGREEVVVRGPDQVGHPGLDGSSVRETERRGVDRRLTMIHLTRGDGRASLGIAWVPYIGRVTAAARTSTYGPDREAEILNPCQRRPAPSFRVSVVIYTDTRCGLEECAMAFHIKNLETDALARKVAALKKIGLTEAVHAALPMSSSASRAGRLWSTSASSSAGICAPRAIRRGTPADKASATACMRNLMFIDASALTALLTDEDEARELLARLQQTGTRLTSPLAVWEAVIAVARVLDLSISAAAEAVESYLALMESPWSRCRRRRRGSRSTPSTGSARPPSGGLNFGDCLPMPAPGIWASP